MFTITKLRSTSLKRVYIVTLWSYFDHVTCFGGRRYSKICIRFKFSLHFLLLYFATANSTQASFNISLCFSGLLNVLLLTVDTINPVKYTLVAYLIIKPYYCPILSVYLQHLELLKISPVVYIRSMLAFLLYAVSLLGLALVSNPRTNYFKGNWTCLFLTTQQINNFDIQLCLRFSHI